MAQSARFTEDSLRMSVETFRTVQETGKNSVLLDVRHSNAWDVADAKIPGALRVYPELKMDPRWPKDQLLLALCACSREATSALVASYLRERGFTEAYALIGGLEAWRLAGFPVEPKAAFALQACHK